jgi:hypothetical protein
MVTFVFQVAVLTVALNAALVLPTVKIALKWSLYVDKLSFGLSFYRT